MREFFQAIKDYPEIAFIVAVFVLMVIEGIKEK